MTCVPGCTASVKIIGMAEEAINIAYDVTREIKEGCSQISNSLSNLTTKVPEQIRKIANFPNKIINDAQGQFNDLKTKFENTSKQVQDEFTTSIKEITNDLTKKTTELQIQISSYFETQTNNIINKQQKFVEDIKHKVKMTDTKLQNVTSQIQQIRNSNENDLKEFNTKYENSNNMMVKFKLELTDEKDGNFEGIYKKLKEHNALTLPELQVKAQHVQDEIKKYLVQVDNIKESFDDSLQNDAQNITDNIESDVSAFNQNLNSRFNDISKRYDALQGTLNNINNESRQLRSQIWQQSNIVPVTLDDDLQECKQQLEKVQHDAQTQFRELQTMMNRLEQAINNQLDDIKNHEQNVCNAIKQDQQRQNDAISPSEVQTLQTKQKNILAQIKKTQELQFHDFTREYDIKENVSMSQVEERVTNTLNSMENMNNYHRKVEQQAKSQITNTQQIINNLVLTQSEYEQEINLLMSDITGKCVQLDIEGNLPQIYSELLQKRKKIDEIMCDVCKIASKYEIQIAKQ